MQIQIRLLHIPLYWKWVWFERSQDVGEAGRRTEKRIWWAGLVSMQLQNHTSLNIHHRISIAYLFEYSSPYIYRISLNNSCREFCQVVLAYCRRNETRCQELQRSPQNSGSPNILCSLWYLHLFLQSGPCQQVVTSLWQEERGEIWWPAFQHQTASPAPRWLFFL